MLSSPGEEQGTRSMASKSLRAPSLRGGRERPVFHRNGMFLPNLASCAVTALHAVRSAQASVRLTIGASISVIRRTFATTIPSQTVQAARLRAESLQCWSTCLSTATPDKCRARKRNVILRGKSSALR